MAVVVGIGEVYHLVLRAVINRTGYHVVLVFGGDDLQQISVLIHLYSLQHIVFYHWHSCHAAILRGALVERYGIDGVPSMLRQTYSTHRAQQHQAE